MKNTDTVLDKTTFQDKMTELESTLARYKTSFPKNFGDMFRSKLALICIVFAVYCILSAFAFASFDNIVKAVFVSLAMLYASVILLYDKSGGRESLLATMEMRNDIKQFEKYPDVKKYGEELDSDISRSVGRKNRCKKVMMVLFYIYVGILSCYIISDFVNDNTLLRDDLENVHAGDNCGVFAKAHEYFHLEHNEPFVVIKPYDAGMSKDNAELFIVNHNTGEGNSAEDCLAGFRFATPKIEGALPTDQYILRITDAEGQPSCLSFKFKAGDEMIDQDICEKEKEALNICNYLYKHSAELRYTLEKQ